MAEHEGSLIEPDAGVGDSSTAAVASDPSHASGIEAFSASSEMMDEENRNPQGNASTSKSSGSTQERPAVAQPVSKVPLIDEGRIQSIKVRVQVMLGGTSVSVAELGALKEGDTIALNARINEPVKILANGHPIGTGKIVVIESNPPSFGVCLESVVDGL